MITVTNGRLAEIVTDLLTNPGSLSGQKAFEKFCTDIAKVVADYCGGNIAKETSRRDEQWFQDDFSSHYSFEVVPTDPSSDELGVWVQRHAKSSIQQTAPEIWGGFFIPVSSNSKEDSVEPSKKGGVIWQKLPRYSGVANRKCFPGGCHAKHSR